MFIKSNSVADKFAILLSSLCLLHCVLTPFLLISVPYLAGFAFLKDEALHIWLLCLVVPASIIAIGFGYTQHKNNTTLMLAFSGIAVLVGAVTIGHEMFGHEAETIMTVIGSILVVSGHVKNLKLRASRYPLSEVRS